MRWDEILGEKREKERKERNRRWINVENREINQFKSYQINSYLGPISVKVSLEEEEEELWSWSCDWDVDDDVVVVDDGWIE